MEKLLAIVYARVSTDRQVNEGHGLDTQVERCLQYAKSKGYKVEKIFREEGISGGLFERPAMKQLIQYLEKYPAKEYVIIVDDIKRIARGTEVHFQIKKEIYGRGSILESPNFRFEETPEGKFVETMLAATAELERNQNTRQVNQKMRARLSQGYYCFKTPPSGYKYTKDIIHGKIIQPTEPLASIYKDAIESFASGLLNTQLEVKSFIEKEYKHKNHKDTVSLNKVKRVLTTILYTGYIEYPKWDIPLVKGHHKGIITLDTYNKVQEKLNKGIKAPIRKDNNNDFPLRGFVLCCHCKKPMTASWHKGRNKRYAHYFCKNRACWVSKNELPRNLTKNVLNSYMHQQFEELLSNIKPTQEVMDLTKAILKDIWANRSTLEVNQQRKNSIHLIELTEQKNNLVNQISKTNSELLRKEYEHQVESILVEIENMKQQSQRTYSSKTFGTACEIVLARIENPIVMWQSDSYRDKRLLLEMFFDDRVTYDLEVGFGTVNLACLPRLLCLKPEENSRLVEMPGVEPGSVKALLKMFCKK